MYVINEYVVYLNVLVMGLIFLAKITLKPDYSNRSQNLSGNLNIGAFWGAIKSTITHVLLLKLLSPTGNEHCTLISDFI